MSAAEGRVQVGLMLGVGAVSAAASFGHVQSLAAAHGQGGWLSWSIAVVVETMALSAGLEMRRRRRGGEPIAAVVGVLVAAVALQLACQVAEAEPSAWGWTLAAVPTVGFFVLVKIALAQSHGRSAAAEPSADRPLAPSVPAEPSAAAVPDRPPAPSVRRPRPSRPAAVRPSAGELLLVGQAVAGELAADGARLTRDALVAAVRARGHTVSNATGSELLRLLREAA